jgi:hypothetical protein
MRSFWRRCIIQFLALFGVIGCSGDFINVLDTDLSISPYLNLPVGRISLTLGDVVPDTGLVSIDSNRFYVSYTLDTALTIYADSLLPKIPSIEFSDSTDISDVSLPNFSQSADLTLGEFGPTSTLTGGLFVFPPLGPVYGGSQALQGNSPVCAAVISQGSVSLTVGNSWPIPVQISVALVNNSNGSTVTNFVFPLILPGGSASQTKNLVGKSFSNNMSFEIVNVQSPGSTGSPVPYTPNDQITFLIQSNNLDVSSGSVVFPQSQLFASSDFFDFGLPNGVRLQEIVVKRAVLRYDLEMPLNGLVMTDITIPYSDNFGSPFGFSINSAPGTPNSGRAILQNVRIDLSKSPGNPYNRLPFEIESNIVGSTSCIGFNANDELRYIFALDSVELDAVVGQFGNYELSLTEEFGLDDLQVGLEFDELVFYHPKLQIDFSNSIGIPVFVDLDLESSNKFGNHKESVSNFPVPFPDENTFPLLREGALVVQPDSTVPFIVLPNQDLKVSIEAKVRSSGSPNPPHFVQLGEDMNVGISLIQESRFGVSNLRYRDTVEVQGPDSTVVSNLLEAFWGVQYKNGLPLDIELDLFALDENGILLFDKSISIIGTEGESKVDLDSVDISKLSQLDKLVWNVRFDSSVGNNLLNASDTLELELSLGGRIKIELL